MDSLMHAVRKVYNENEFNDDDIIDRLETTVFTVLESKAKVEASLASAHHLASFLAASCQHSGDWLFALPIAHAD